MTIAAAKKGSVMITSMPESTWGALTKATSAATNAAPNTRMPSTPHTARQPVRREIDPTGPVVLAAHQYLIPIACAYFQQRRIRHGVRLRIARSEDVVEVARVGGQLGAAGPDRGQHLVEDLGEVTLQPAAPAVTDLLGDRGGGRVRSHSPARVNRLETSGRLTGS
jgi:hypothetical protein